MPLNQAYYVPRFRGKPILPDGFKLAEKKSKVAREIITPAIDMGGFVEEAEVNAEEQSETMIRQFLSQQSALVFKRVRITPEASKIFGSVTPQDISESLLETHGVTFPKENITGKFKDIGQHKCFLQFSEGEPLEMVVDIIESEA